MSIYSKYRGRTYVDSDVEPHFSHKRYRIYHRRIQKIQCRFHQDYYCVSSDADDDNKEIFTGMNKQIEFADYGYYIDKHKDGK